MYTDRCSFQSIYIFKLKIRVFFVYKYDVTRSAQNHKTKSKAAFIILRPRLAGLFVQLRASLVAVRTTIPKARNACMHIIPYLSRNAHASCAHCSENRNTRVHDRNGNGLLHLNTPGTHKHTHSNTSNQPTHKCTRKCITWRPFV